jgi:hypothetical protein
VSIGPGTLHSFSQAPQKVESIHLRHHHVQDQEVEGAPSETSESGCSVRRVRGLKILPCQEFNQHAREANIVIHDEDLACGHI